MAYSEFAASVQSALENTILKFAAELKEVTGTEAIVISGGVALNCSANRCVEESGLFKRIYIPPFASDAGTAVGAALEVSNTLFGIKRTPSPLRSASLGASYSVQYIQHALQKYGKRISFSSSSTEDLLTIVSQKLSEGCLVGWMQGRFEGGPRALGNRSILADPRTRFSLVRLNKIKRREMWRPIAPSVLKKFYCEYFSGSPENKHFMNVACRVHSEKQHLIPAVVHVDGTARPQVVTEDDGIYFDLIEAFRRITGIPMICNTSFNSQGLPLVNTPEDAVDCYLECGLDLLVIENYIVQKK